MTYLITYKGINLVVDVLAQTKTRLSMTINSSKPSERVINGIVTVNIKRTGEGIACDKSIFLQTIITTGNPDNVRLLVDVFNKTVKENNIPGGFIATLPAIVNLETKVEHCL